MRFYCAKKMSEDNIFGKILKYFSLFWLDHTCMGLTEKS